MKKYVSMWGDWDELAKLSYQPASKEHGISIINEGAGYEPEEIESIKALNPGEMFKHPYGNHYIVRIS